MLVARAIGAGGIDPVGRIDVGLHPTAMYAADGVGLAAPQLAQQSAQIEHKFPDMLRSLGIRYRAMSSGQSKPLPSFSATGVRPRLRSSASISRASRA